MADLSKLKVGDKLRLEVTVTDLDESDWRYPVSIDRGQWLDGETIEAAEHIPAPRVFKRGDWVSWRAHGAVQMVVADDVDDELIWVTSDNPAQNILWRKQDCEPTEAPE